jgi:putative ATP-dependent endonuclease of the OLD family
MRISRIRIENFRNFKLLDVGLGDHAIIVGENKIGKSNLLFALRILLDPSLPDSMRQLREEDFWDGISRPPTKDDRILISVEFSDFDGNISELAVLAEHLVGVAPMTSRLTYVFQPLPSLEKAPSKAADYEFFVFGGERPDNTVSYELRRRMPMDILPALRDAEGDLANWRRSPLRPLLEEAASKVAEKDLADIAEKVSEASKAITAIPEIKALDNSVTGRLHEMVGNSHAVDVTLGLSPTDPNRLIRALRPFIDHGRRGIGEASLGSANLIYLALKSLEFQQLVQQGNRDHTFLAIEEPEAHLHPHLQRLVYRDFLRPRSAAAKAQAPQAVSPNTSVLLTTHSPHIVSVAPVKSLVLLRRDADGLSTNGYSTAGLDLEQKDIADLERYLDVNRGEIVFSRGVLLVEGDAECFILPMLAKQIGYDLDELGISVCSVSGTNFAPYVKLLGPTGLNIPFAVITDLDPVDDGNTLGLPRVRKLLESSFVRCDLSACDNGSIAWLASEFGFFINKYTLEIELFSSGNGVQMCDTILQLTDNGAAKKRAEEIRKNPSALDPEQFLKDIEGISKGRFAQRLATNLNPQSCPEYIRDAVKYVASRCK